MRKKITILLYCFIVLVLSLPSVWSLIGKSGLFPSHDAVIHIYRTEQLDKILKDGQIPPRWAPDLAFSYGYPIFNFTYPLPEYLVEVLHVFGFSFSDAVRWVFILAMIISGLTMFIFAKDFWGNLGGLLSAVFYVYAPYHALDLYVRGSLGEMLSFVFMPLILWLGYKVSECPASWRVKVSKKYIIAGGISYGLLILSHNIIAMLFTGFLFIGLLAYWLIGLLKRKSMVMLLCCYVVMLFIGLGLSAFFWLPAVFEMKYTVINKVVKTIFNYKDHFVYPLQYIYSPWGFGGSKPGPVDGMSFRLGKIYFLIFLIPVFLLIFKKITDGKRKWAIIFFSSLSVLSLFMTLPVSHFFWDNLLLLPYVQFPWRFLAFVILGISFPAGSLIYIARKKNPRIALIITLILIVWLLKTNMKFFQPGPGEFKNDDFYLTTQNILHQTSTYGNEHLPIWVQKMPAEKPQNKIEIISGRGEIKIKEIKSQIYTAEINAATNLEVAINTFYFPGWKAYLNAKEILIDSSNEYGLMQIKIPQGKHLLKIKLTNTFFQFLGNSISLITFLLILTLITKYICDRIYVL